MKKMHTPLFKVLSIIVYIDAFIWLVGVVPTLYYAFTHRILPTFGGIRLLGGPFERLGLDALIVAGIGYIMVQRVEDPGRLLVVGRQDGRRGPRDDPAGIERHILVRFCLTLRASPGSYPGSFAGACLEDPELKEAQNQDGSASAACPAAGRIEANAGTFRNKK